MRNSEKVKNQVKDTNKALTAMIAIDREYLLNLQYSHESDVRALMLKLKT